MAQQLLRIRPSADLGPTLSDSLGATSTPIGDIPFPSNITPCTPTKSNLYLANPCSIEETAHILYVF